MQAANSKQQPSPQKPDPSRGHTRAHLGVEYSQQGALLQPPVRLVRAVEQEEAGGGPAQVRDAPERVGLAAGALPLRHILHQHPDGRPGPVDGLRTYPVCAPWWRQTLACCEASPGL